MPHAATDRSRAALARPQPLYIAHRAERGVRSGVLAFRRGRKAVAAPLGELLMVVVMIVMAASVYLMYGALVQDAANIPTSITFRSVGTTPATIPGICCLNDTTIEVVTTLGNPQVWAPAIEYTIESTQNGQLLVQGYLEEEPANLTLIYLGVYHGSDAEPSIVNIWYADVDHNGIISLSDHISVRGMSQEFHGAKMIFFASGHTLGQQIIP